MRQHALPIGIAMSLLTGVTTAQAAIETWVSGTGADAGNCAITAPCRTFAFAHNQTNGGGAINVLSSGNFGPLTITKPISIVAQGAEALINTAADGAGIIVQAGSAAIISLRGLTIDLRGTANTGISFVSGAALHVQGCVIRRPATGINFTPASGTSELYVGDSVIENATNGIIVVPSASGGANVALDRVRVENSGNLGIQFQGNNTTGVITATVRESVVAGNTGVGIHAVEAGAGATTVMVDRSASVNNRTGIRSHGTGATIRIGDSTVIGNTFGLVLFGGGVIESYGTNQVNGNGADGAPTSTISMK
jgi:hypothetical protein